VPTPPPPIYAEEDAPENAAPDSDDDVPKRPKANSQYSSYRGNASSNVFSSEDANLHSVDLSLPLGQDEKLPQIQAYMSPEELQRREQIRFRTEKKAALESKSATKVNIYIISLRKPHLPNT
jgi:AP-3 complex subunit delta-1